MTISSVRVDILVISLIFAAVFLLLFIFITFRWLLSQQTHAFNKNYTALLINFNQMIEMKIPFIQRKSGTDFGNYSRPTQTETYHLCEEANSDFYRSVLSMSELPYYPVRETVFDDEAKTAAPITIVSPNQTQGFIV